jgi:pyrroline-5-carboxylate reductase
LTGYPISGQSLIVSLLEACGIVIPCDEKSLDVSGCCLQYGSAWAMLFVEALADGAVLSDLRAMSPSAPPPPHWPEPGKLVLQTGLHPGVLKDQVCSPGGTTIEGIRALERGAFRSSVIEAVAAAMEKTEKMTARDG